MSETILITGAAQRVGLHCALALQHQGYQVIATYRQERPGVSQLREAGVICHHVDFAKPDAILNLVEKVSAQAPVLRALIHNASSWQPDAKLPTCMDAKAMTSEALERQLQQDAHVFDDMMHIHAKVPWLLTRALLPNLQASPVADVIALTDFVASVGSSKHMAYAASRAAMENLLLSMARQLAPKVKVNGIAPALLMFNEGDDADYQQKALAKSLMQTTPGPDEVLRSINYVMHSQYITGRILALDGGRHLNLP